MLYAVCFLNPCYPLIEGLVSAFASPRQWRWPSVVWRMVVCVVKVELLERATIINMIVYAYGSQRPLLAALAAAPFWRNGVQSNTIRCVSARVAPPYSPRLWTPAQSTRRCRYQCQRAASSLGLRCSRRAPPPVAVGLSTQLPCAWQPRTDCACALWAHVMCGAGSAIAAHATSPHTLGPTPRTNTCVHPTKAGQCRFQAANAQAAMFEHREPIGGWTTYRTVQAPPP